MPSNSDGCQALKRLLMRRKVADLGAVLAALQTTSRMTAVRKLSEVGYLSSYSHSGAYYTLQTIPQFDGDGLWLFEGVGFSRHGTLKDTVAVLVDRSEDGQLHRELQRRLQVRVHNTLLGLVQGQRLAREIVGDEYLYVSADPARGSAQLARRRDRGPARGAGTLPPAALVLEILLDVIQAARLRCDVNAIAARLGARRVVVTVDQVREVLRQYGLSEKKTRSTSARSRL